MPFFEFPTRNLISTGGASAASNVTLTANGNYVAIIFVAEATITLKKVGVRVETVTNLYVTPTPPASPYGRTVEISIQTVQSDGFPSGTAVITEDFTCTSTVPSVGWWEYTFASTATLNAGTPYALVVKAKDANWANTPAATLAIAPRLTNTAGGFNPYSVRQEAASAQTKVSERLVEIFYLIDNAGSPKVYGFPFYEDDELVQAINNTTPEAGMQFKIPTSVCTTYKVRGIRVTTTQSLSALSPNVGIAIYEWNSGNYVAALDTNDFPVRQQAIPTTAAAGVHEFYFDNPPVLNAGTKYVVSLYTTNASSTVTVTSLRGFNISDTLKPAMWDQTNDYEYNRVSRTSMTGSWTTNADSLSLMTLLCSVESLPSGGGLLVHPGMAGGMRG